MPKEIYFYSNNLEYSWLSNFYPAYFKLKNRNWPTVEHYYQTMKALDPIEQERIRQLEHPSLVKRMGGV